MTAIRQRRYAPGVSAAHLVAVILDTDEQIQLPKRQRIYQQTVVTRVQCRLAIYTNDQRRGTCSIIDQLVPGASEKRNKMTMTTTREICVGYRRTVRPTCGLARRCTHSPCNLSSITKRARRIACCTAIRQSEAFLSEIVTGCGTDRQGSAT